MRASGTCRIHVAPADFPDVDQHMCHVPIRVPRSDRFKGCGHQRTGMVRRKQAGPTRENPSGNSPKFLPETPGSSPIIAIRWRISWTIRENRRVQKLV